MITLLKIIGSTALTRSIALILTTFACASVMAEEGDLRFTMTSIEDASYGDEIIAGNYESAIEKITAYNGHVNAFVYNTNLCVAYTKIGDTGSASLACDAAVQALENRRILRAQGKTTYRRFLAVALTNRGVVQVAMGEFERALQDFDAALALNEQPAAAKINLARLREVREPKV